METYHGHVRTPADAIILFEACRTGVLPRVQRRLSEKERQSIKSGSIFVWDEREAGMRRWTDGKSWSASRVSGSFLTYREMEGKRGGNGFSSSTPRSGREGSKSADPDSNDDGPNGYRYKADGLMKQSFSITTSTGQHLHLISYYSRTASAFPNLPQPSQDPRLRDVRPEKGLYPESTVHDHSSIPAVTRAPMTGTGFSAPPNAMPPVGSPFGRGTAPPPPYAGYGAPSWAPPSPMHTPPPHYQHYYGQPSNAYPTPYHPSPPYPTSHPLYPPYGYPPPPPSATLERGPPPFANHALPPIPSHAANALAPLNLPTSSSSTHAIKAEPVARTYQPAMSNGQSVNGEASRHDSVHPRPGESQRGRKSVTPPPVNAPAATLGSTTIPSINSLINDAQAASEEHARRSGSKSPGHTLPGARPLQDIPLHKIAFNPISDARALRDLDKATFRV